MLTPKWTWSSMLIVASFSTHVLFVFTVFGKLDAVSCIVASRLQKIPWLDKDKPNPCCCMLADKRGIL